MRMYADTEAKAQALADRAHAFLIANDSAYAKSVGDGKTLRWATPMQDSAGWWIAVADRCAGAFTVQELAGMVDDE